MITLVDAHAHVFSADATRYPIPEAIRQQLAERLADPFTVELLLAAMDLEGVHCALLVQRSQFYGFDNGYVCEASAAAADRLRPVCAIDARQADCEMVARNWISRGAAGFRLMQQTRDDDLDWLGGGTAAPLWRLCADHGLPLCVHFFPWNRERGLTLLLRTMGDCRGTLVVVDHLSNCPIDDRGNLQADDLLREFAAQPNAYAKLTTIPLGAMAKKGLPFDPLIDACRQLFGFERILWGSDITQSPGTYHDMTEHIRKWCERLSAGEAYNLAMGNTARLYGMNVKPPERARLGSAGTA